MLLAPTDQDVSAPENIAATSSAVSPPEAPPSAVFMLVRCTTSADAMLAMFASMPDIVLPDTYIYTLPLLKPNQPNHSINVPSVTKAMS
jgi:hypothetical protein